ncbi:MAG: cytochrome c3 family protein [Actinomycetia bacterium]|nr:cytochrome c3 family protein [Actinomycetes bacterium]
MGRHLLIIGAFAAALVVAHTSAASAYQEPYVISGSVSDCTICHFQGGFFGPNPDDSCVNCHATPPYDGNAPGFAFDDWKGPHGNYTASTTKCRVCHSVHNAPAGGVLLLAGATVTDTCFTCHDGTGGWGVYGTIKARTGVDPQDRDPATGGAAHRMIEPTSTIPGGDSATGGDATRMFSGTGGVLACNDCHSVHGAQTVGAFKGDRIRVRANEPSPATDRLLKKRPTGASSETTAYGSDWCAGCHAGRMSGGVVENHPVDAGPGAFTYSQVAILATEAPTATTIFGPLGGVPYDWTYSSSEHWVDQPSNSGNRGYLMPWPRTPEQGAHKPICQQCHEDSRNAGALDATGTIGDAAPARIVSPDSVTWDGSTWVTTTADNPRFQNFPHETVNDYMLVEGSPTTSGDDLCMNCHPQGQLP